MHAFGKPVSTRSECPSSSSWWSILTPNTFDAQNTCFSKPEAVQQPRLTSLPCTTGHHGHSKDLKWTTKTSSKTTVCNQFRLAPNFVTDTIHHRSKTRGVTWTGSRSRSPCCSTTPLDVSSVHHHGHTMFNFHYVFVIISRSQREYECAKHQHGCRISDELRKPVQTPRFAITFVCHPIS